jgi:3-oxoacyl-[acyl-carrier-protein] synthase II
VLEELEHAFRRDAHVYAELVGYGQTNDAYHMTAPRPDGFDAARAISLSLRDGSLEPSEVGYLNAHATGTPLGDSAEASAIALAFGDAIQGVAVSGTKGMYGHLLGASGALEAALTCQALERGFLPGTANLEAPDADMALHLVPPEGAVARPQAAVSTSFGFGGANVSLAFRAWQA